MNKLIKDISYIIVLTFCLMHLIPLLTMLLDPVVKTEVIKHTYVSWIVTPTYGEKKVRKVLDNFNKLGHNKIIKYEGNRPVFIYEKNLSGNILGQARPLPGYCIIQIRPGLTEWEFEHVLIHEMLHCQFIFHSRAPCTLMYPTLMKCYPGTLMEMSKKYYAMELVEKMYE